MNIGNNTEVKLSQMVDVKDDPEALAAVTKDLQRHFLEHVEAISESPCHIICYRVPDGDVALVGATPAQVTELMAQMLNSIGIMYGACSGEHIDDEHGRIAAAAGALMARIADQYPEIRTKLGTVLMATGVMIVEGRDPVQFLQALRQKGAGAFEA